MSQPTFEDLLLALAAEHHASIRALQDENTKIRQQLQNTMQGDQMTAPSGRQAPKRLSISTSGEFFRSDTASSKEQAGDCPGQLVFPRSPYGGIKRNESGISSLPSFFSDTPASESTTKSKTWRQMLDNPVVDITVSCLIFLNTALMACELQFQGLHAAYEQGFPNSSPQASSSGFFQAVDIMFTAIFSLELTARVLILRRGFLKVMNFIDVLAVASGIVYWIVSKDMGVNPKMIRLVRLGKLGRTVHITKMSRVFDSLRLLLKCMSASVSTLICALGLILIIQCVAGMLISQLVSAFIADPDNDFNLRLRLFNYYGTFTRSMLTMFEVTLANWSPPCRILVDNVSELYSALFIIYRCLIGFACLNVINAVFIQQTMRVAAQDKEIMIMQRERSQADNSKKMQEIFHALDESGDGMISWTEFRKVLYDPVLKTWMSAMELDIADLKGLWNLLDDGKGHIIAEDFIQGAARVKGPAKGFDMAQVLLNSKRIEHKIDALSEEMSSSPLFNRKKIDAIATQRVDQRSSQDIRSSGMTMHSI